MRRSGLRGRRVHTVAARLKDETDDIEENEKALAYEKSNIARTSECIPRDFPSILAMCGESAAEFASVLSYIRFWKGF